MNRRILYSGGFTLIEIMVSLAISSLVIGGIYGVYTIQQKSYTVQEQVTEMQQKLRSALDFMTRDMRMANYNPGGACAVNVEQSGLTIRSANQFSFEYCENNVLQQVSYSMSGNNLVRNLTVTGIIGQTKNIAEGVDAIEFRYLQGNGKDEATTAQETRIVRLSILIRGSYPDASYTDTTLYKPSSGSTTAWASLNNGSGNPPNDHYHRMSLVTSIELRNVGL